MICISAKLSTKSKSHGKSYITHILFGIVLSLVKAALGQRSRGSCCGETLICIPQVCEEQKVKP